MSIIGGPWIKYTGIFLIVGWTGSLNFMTTDFVVICVYHCCLLSQCRLVGGIRVLVAVSTGIEFHGTCILECFSMYFTMVIELSRELILVSAFFFLEFLLLIWLCIIFNNICTYIFMICFILIVHHLTDNLYDFNDFLTKHWSIYDSKSMLQSSTKWTFFQYFILVA